MSKSITTRICVCLVTSSRDSSEPEPISRAIYDNCANISGRRLLTRSCPIWQHSRRVLPTASPSPSTPAEASPPASPGNSSMKWSAAPKGSRASADAAAARTFSHSSRLPVDQDTLANAKALEGRQRLTGAFLIEIDRVRPDPHQPRKAFEDKAQWELQASIEKLGILQPVTVQYLESENIYQIITGEGRFEASKSLGLTSIPCWVRNPDSQTTLVHQIVENWQRAELHPYDLADALAALRDSFGFSQKQIADLTGKPESEISRPLSLLKLNPAAQQHAREDKTGTFTRRHLIALAQLPQEDQQEVMI